MRNSRSRVGRVVRKKTKYGNIKTGHYDSRHESSVATQLHALMREGEALGTCIPQEKRIVKIEEQVPYVLIPSQRDPTTLRVIERPCKYIADFRVTYADGRVAVIDAKGVRTPEYIIKRKLMLQLYAIRIREV